MRGFYDAKKRVRGRGCRVKTGFSILDRAGELDSGRVWAGAET